jgi:4-amino-4-deoxy-L-arabinose transferase-like glycosyltransferase
VFALWHRRALAFLLDPIGICLFVLLVLIWPLDVYWTYPPAVASLWREHTARLSGAWGRQSPLLYVYSTLLLTLPWTPLLIIGGVAWWRDRARAAPIWRLLALWFALGAIFLSLSPFKHWHYLVPVLPPLSILAAFGLDRFLCIDRPRYSARAALIVIATILAPPAIYRFVPQAAGAISILVLTGALGTSAALYCQWRGGGRLAAATLFITAWIVSVAAHVSVTPRFQTYLGQKRFADRVNSEVPAESTLYLLGPVHNQMVYYLTMPIVPAGDAAMLARTLEAGARTSTAFVLGPRWTGATVARLGKLEDVDRCKSLRRGESEHDRLTLMKLSIK